MIHRYLAGTLRLAVLGIFILSIAKMRALRQSIILPTTLLITVIFQAALGLWTVTILLSPVIVTAHLIGGFTTLGLTWLLFINQSLWVAVAHNLVAALLLLTLIPINHRNRFSGYGDY